MRGLFIALVVSAAVSWRGASRGLQLWGRVWELREAAPTWYTGRVWLLRVSYYKLTRAKEHTADWVRIIDHTIQLGGHAYAGRGGGGPPVEPALGEVFGAEPEPLAVIDEEFERRAGAGAEDVNGAAQGIVAQRLATHGG